MKFLAKRIWMYFLILAGVSVIVFSLTKMLPGDPYSSLLLNPNVSEAYVERKLNELGMNDPLPIQYGKWVGRLLQGDLGYTLQGEPVLEEVLHYLKNTLILTVPAYLFSILLSVVLGVYSASRENRLSDKIITIATFLQTSIPSFFLAIILIRWLGYDWQLFPPSGMETLRMNYSGWDRIADVLRHMVLPVAVLTVNQTSGMVRYVRSAVLDVLNQNYIRTAQAKGLSRKKAIWKHGLRNALIPVITVFFMNLPGIISGALFTETVFVWPGIGTLNYNAIMERDYSVIIAVAMLTACLILLSNLAADVFYVVADPRIRLEGKEK